MIEVVGEKLDWGKSNDHKNGYFIPFSFDEEGGFGEGIFVFFHQVSDNNSWTTTDARLAMYKHITIFPMTINKIIGRLKMFLYCFCFTILDFNGQVVEDLGVIMDVGIGEGENGVNG